MNIQQFVRGWGGARLLAIAGMVVVSIVVMRPAQAVRYVSVDVRIETPQQTVYNDTVYIPDNGCTVTDSTGTSHAITGFSALCALNTAATQGNFSYRATSFGSFGLFIDSIAGIAGDAKNYWLYYVNQQQPAVGIGAYTVQEGDEVLLSHGQGSPPLRLQLDVQNPRVSDTVLMTVDAAQYNASIQSNVFVGVQGATLYVFDGTNSFTLVTNANGQVSYAPPAPGNYTVQAVTYGYTRSITVPFRVYKRYHRLKRLGRSLTASVVDRSRQQLRTTVDDSGLVYDSIVVAEWSAMALAASGRVPDRLADAVKNYTPTELNGTSELSRHILALKALDENPHDFRDVNYVQRLFNTMNNEAQFGDSALCNDDIFAVLALLSVGMDPETEGLQQGLSHTLKCVSVDGGVSFVVGGGADVDTTAAWLMMIGRYDDVAPRLTDAQYAVQQSALDYLRNSQNPDGGWGYTVGQPSNSSSTAWVLMALRAQHHEAKAMTTNYRNGFNFLRSAWDEESGTMHYDADGTMSFEPLNTAYALMAFARRPFPVNVPAKLHRRLVPSQQRSVLNR